MGCTTIREAGVVEMVGGAGALARGCYMPRSSSGRGVSTFPVGASLSLGLIFFLSASAMFYPENFRAFAVLSDKPVSFRTS